MALPLRYNLRNLFVRKLSTSLTFCVITVVVLVLSVLLSFAAGIQASLAVSASELNLIVIKPGATAESTSIIPYSESKTLIQTPGLARNAAGKELLSEELTTQTSLPRIGTGSNMANVAVRGVDPIAFDVHTNVRVTEGRCFEQGKDEVIVGRATAQRIAGLTPGSRVPLGRLGNRQFEVVGLFEAEGGALESEIWTGRSVLSDIEDRRNLSSVMLRLADRSTAAAAMEYVRGPSVQLAVKSETQYYDDMATTTRQIVVLTSALVGIMAIGAVFAVANTMFAAVDSRRREIAMLRTLGFSRNSILIAFVAESLLISVAAASLGLALSLFVNGARQDYLSDMTWTVLAYELRMTPTTVSICVGLSLAVGVVGAAFPALRASRVQVIEALRKA